MKLHYLGVALFGAALSLTGTSLPSAAQELYRWVDEDGKVHFGDRPPAEVQAKSIKAQLKPVNGAAPTRREDFPDLDREKKIEQEYQAKKRAQHSRSEQQRRTACAQARKQLKILQGRVYFVDEAGNESTISERQRVEEARKLEAQIRQLCG
ncbi:MULTISPECIES: DUF4124 domain-containing protein [Microbulbifer]|uniref:DUF4124 domain-containing protein n=1 Tax=Microbulbifer celer TaxID=435905 RepID=A0ABW3UBS6_9GAMM|nr:MULTISPECIES: DUF4124 domain-containing protein [Microbulbifer]UFN57203.1 DUF4124 domain-containing protein [Microbulbifer celer]